MTKELQDAITHHLIREARPLHQSLLVKELERISVVNHDIPTAPAWEWMEALDGLVEAGSVIRAGERVQINRERFVTHPVPTKTTRVVQSDESTQGTLF